MRKDMKFAWAAGGLLVAIMAIYLIVAGTSGRNKNSQPVELVTEVPAESAAKAAQPSVAKAPPTATATDAAQASAASPADNETKSGKDVWGALLTTGRPPAGMLMTETPQKAAAVAPQATESSDAADMGDSAAAAQPAVAANTAASTAIAPANVARPSAGSSKHVVQAGETFSTIAAQAYGSSAYWSHIARANPNVNPRHLKVGMVLNVPDAAQVKGAAKTAATPAASAQPIDPAKQYTVQASDSLYKISMKLYHSPKYVDKIYELNKEAIGANPAHLKLNMVLQLPQPPVSGQ